MIRLKKLENEFCKMVSMYCSEQLISFCFLRLNSFFLWTMIRCMPMPKKQITNKFLWRLLIKIFAELTYYTTGSWIYSSGVICSNSVAVWQVHHANNWPVSSPSVTFNWKLSRISLSHFKWQKLQIKDPSDESFTGYPQIAWDFIKQTSWCSILTTQVRHICR